MEIQPENPTLEVVRFRGHSSLIFNCRCLCKVRSKKIPHNRCSVCQGKKHPCHKKLGKYYSGNTTQNLRALYKCINAKSIVE